jgi:hypothetical protein
MNRLVLVGAFVAGACGGADDRPPTLEYITETILAPSCASAECHSAFKREVGDQFDTPEAARRTIVTNGLATPDDQADPGGSYLVTTLTVGQISVIDSSEGAIRMPYDSPLPDADIDLIKAWIALGVPGAQCVPNDQGLGCATTPDGTGGSLATVVQCGDGNIGAVVTTCTSTQSCGNGTCAP